MEPQEDTEGSKPAGPEAGPEAGPGAWLASAREQAGWSLLQAADQLHLDVSAVKALEAGRFEVLGAAVYARGHLRRYAELLGLPPQEVEKAFLQSNPARSAPDLRHGAGLLQKSDAAAGALRPGTAALGAVILVIVGVILWAKRMPHTHDAPASSATVATAVPRPDAPAVDAPAIAPAVADAKEMPSTLDPAASPIMPAMPVMSDPFGQPAPLWDPAREVGTPVTPPPASKSAPVHSPGKPTAKTSSHAHSTRP